jgi:hypothetical protein
MFSSNSSFSSFRRSREVGESDLKDLARHPRFLVLLAYLEECRDRKLHRVMLGSDKADGDIRQAIGEARAYNDAFTYLYNIHKKRSE